MKAASSNYKDVNKYFHGTYVIIPEVNPKRVYSLIDESPAGLCLRDPETSETGYISFENEFEYTIQSPLTARKMWFQHEDSAYLIQRIPARQWQKGISEANTSISRLTGTGTLSGVTVRYEYLNAMLNFTPPSVPFNPEAISWALSSTYALATDKSTVFLWDSCIGKLAKRTKELFIPKELQELHLPETLAKLKVKYV